MERIEKRRIETEAMIPFVEELEKIMSVETIISLLTNANKREAYSRGKSISPDNPSYTIERLLEDVKTWGNGGVMEITFIEKTRATLFFDVKKCPYHELYKKLGIERYGFAFSCCRDESFATGLNEKLKLDRRRTLMNGDDCCDFRYTLEE